MDTTAGSGRHGTPDTTVCRVDSIDDDDDTGTETDQTDRIVSGQLRYCLETLAPTGGSKTIIFDVSGTIELTSNMTIGGTAGADAETKGSYITIAGQTAPSPGITIKNYTFIIERKCHDILIQHMRFRPGDEIEYASPDSVDGLVTSWSCTGGATPSTEIVIDHCSFSWGIDENIDLGSNNTTVINSIISEGLSSNQHSKGEHSKGLISSSYCVNSGGGRNGTLNVAVINNLFINNKDRMPNITSGDAVVANNYIVKKSTTALHINDYTQAQKGSVRASIAGNYVKDTGSGTEIYLIIGHHADSRIYVDNTNYLDGAIRTDFWTWITTDHDAWERSDQANSATDIAGGQIESSPTIWPTGYETMTAAAAKAYVLTNAGARPSDRDVIDTRLIVDATAETDRDYIDTVYWSDDDDHCTGWKQYFDGGTVEMTATDTVTGADSGESGTLIAQVKTAGEYDGSAEGYLILTSMTGTFNNNENLQVAAATEAVADGTGVGAGSNYINMACCSDVDTGDCIQVVEENWPSLAENTDVSRLPSNFNRVTGSGYTKLEEWIFCFTEGCSNPAVSPAIGIGF